MRVSLSWLKEYVDFDLDAVELARRLTETLTETVAVRTARRGRHRAWWSRRS